MSRGRSRRSDALPSSTLAVLVAAGARAPGAGPELERRVLEWLRSLEQRRDGLEAQSEIAAPRSPWALTIANLRCLRGIDTVTAYGLCCEVCDFHRFEHPTTLTGYLGIIPSEHSSGESVKRGQTPKAGSPLARRLLVEAAHQYRHKPAIYKTLAARQRGQDPRACEISWRCQQRLHRQWQRLRVRRGKPANVVTIALARELACFVWEVGQLT